MISPRRALRAALERCESAFDRAYGAECNPLYQLGALGWFSYWIVLASGVYLYVFFDSGASEAYESVEYMTNVQWFAAGVMRSLHRYASDALVIVMLLHLAREWAKDRYRDARWFGWVTGLPLIAFVYASGISGYWIVWDRLAQYVALATGEWLDALPLFAEAIARNFIHPTLLSDRFFTLMVFIHIAVPLMLLFAMWLHIQRHMLPRVTPPRPLLIGTSLMLLALSLAYPARSQGPARLDQIVGTIGLDWFYLPLYPLLDRYPGELVWMGLLGSGVVLALLPWLPRAREPAAVVDLANCNGCGRCVADCPYSAVDLRPRSDGTPFTHEAVVAPERCVSCGICAGACPTATPFRRRSALLAGIELPQLSSATLRERIVEASAGIKGGTRIVVFGCRDGARLDALADPHTAVIELPCLGALPPPFIDFVLARGHADGVFLAGCRAGDCEFRLGQEWTHARLDATRDPHLRARVPRQRLCSAWLGRSSGMPRALAAFRRELGELGPARAFRGDRAGKPEVIGHDA